ELLVRDPPGGVIHARLQQLRRLAEGAYRRRPESVLSTDRGSAAHAISSAGCAAWASSAALRAIGAYRPNAALRMSTARGSIASASSSDAPIAASRAASPSSLIFA